jgi:predicted DNA-binding transcriptional regulator AlpA
MRSNRRPRDPRHPHSETAGARQRIGLGSTAIYERLDPRSKYFDPDFPKPIPLGSTERVRATGWIEAEIEQWLAKQIQRRVQRSKSMQAAA